MRGFAFLTLEKIVGQCAEIARPKVAGILGLKAQDAAERVLFESGFVGKVRIEGPKHLMLVANLGPQQMAG